MGQRRNRQRLKVSSKILNSSLYLSFITTGRGCQANLETCWCFLYSKWIKYEIEYLLKWLRFYWKDKAFYLMCTEHFINLHTVRQIIYTHSDIYILIIYIHTDIHTHYIYTHTHILRKTYSIIIYLWRNLLKWLLIMNKLLNPSWLCDHSRKQS